MDKRSLPQVATAPGPAQLAAEFLAAHDGHDWRSAFAAWADQHGIGEAARHELRVEILRARAFGAALHGTARAARRRAS